jgi:hypothetical protein
MALTLNTVIDGPRRAVIQVQIDDTSGDEAATVVVDISALNPNGDGLVPVRVTVERVCASLDGFSARLEYDHTANTLILPIATDLTIDKLFRTDKREFPGSAGWKDTGTIGDGTGDIVITTTGNLAGDFGVMEISVRKEYAE